MSTQQETTAHAPLDTPKTAFGVQMAILAELRLQTALLRQVAGYAGRSEARVMEEGKVASRKLEFKAGLNAAMSRNRAVVATMLDSNASAQTRIGAAKALVSAATTVESGEQSQSSVPESQDAPP